MHDKETIDSAGMVLAGEWCSVDLENRSNIDPLCTDENILPFGQEGVSITVPVCVLTVAWNRIGQLIDGLSVDVQDI